MLNQGDEVLIIGGGLQGCAIGLFLARAGWNVTIVEKGMAGRHASSVNAGGLRLLLRDEREYPLALRAMEMWETLEDFVGPDAARRCEVRLGTSQIAIALDEAEMTWALARAKDMIGIGIHTEELMDLKELHHMLPGLNPATLGALISRRDGHANPANAALAFRNAAVAAGVRLIEHCGVSELVPLGGGRWKVSTDVGLFEAERVINCAGAWGTEIAALVGDYMPMKAHAPTMMVTTRVKPWITPVVIGIDRPLSFKQSAAGSLVIGGGISGKPCPSHGTSFTVMDRATAGAAATIEAFPALAGIPVVRTWTGLEGKTPDGIPYITPSSNHDGLWHVFGFCGHGFQLAPAVGEVVAQSLISGQVDPRLAPFTMERVALTTKTAAL
ncbi:NAD(P)/FAD-dependent oxidoreductase [Pseudomonas sp. NPDC089734]|uniref:NAD(P)/FAD-dependent oxidoreductase n=1 Tax=Pseudomonas sp. NPDC089734 TaxID=3364469 RepID=UPI0038102948